MKFPIITVLSFSSLAESFLAPRKAPWLAFLEAAPKRLDENVNGVLYVNDKVSVVLSSYIVYTVDHEKSHSGRLNETFPPKENKATLTIHIISTLRQCINCSACANFAPLNFKRTKTAHVVYQQPSTHAEIVDSRAAMAACPVAAIRIETEAHRHHRRLEPLTDEEKVLAKNMALSPKLNGYDLPFPRPLTHNVWYLGHHNEKSFGATPYLLHTSDEQRRWIMVDTPRYGKSAIEAIKSLTGSNGPDVLLLTHVDDTADHGKWVEEFPSLRRIFHSGDLGRHNWLGDDTLEHVEILLHSQSSSSDELKAFDLDGTPLTTYEAAQRDVVIYHTPGHSPGSISLLDRPSGVIFTGDTLGYSNRLDTLTGFPRYGNDLSQQAGTLRLLKLLNWTLVCPGHGHVRDYGPSRASRDDELDDAIQELLATRL